jgi:alpha-N-arabinofuranosidase
MYPQNYPLKVSRSSLSLTLGLLLALAGPAAAQPAPAPAAATSTPATAAPAAPAAAPVDAAVPAGPPPVPSLQIDAATIAGHSSPILFGFMTEEINFSYDGGLYAELIRNRTFQDNADEPVNWSLVQDPGGNGSISLDTSVPLNDKLPVSLRLDSVTANATARVGFSNEGFWGIPVRPSTTYKASFYAKAAGNFTGPVNVAIASTTNPVTYAYATVPKLTADWQKYEVTLTTGANITPTKDANFLILTNSTGTAWFDLVSLFPPTYNDRPNGNRQDIMALLDQYHSGFLRFPGGNFLEGNTLAERFNWKDTIGDISQRPGHGNSAWSYRASDGMGLLEFLEWCEDLKMQPLLAVYAGLSLRDGEVAHPGPDLAPYVQDALDEIEYVTGNTSTKWGAERAKDGHPEPFQLNYVEIGNEDWRGDYNGRFTQIYDAIKAKYPNIQIIDSSVHSPNAAGKLTSRATDRTADVQDSHLYTNSRQQSENASHEFDKTDRTGPKVFKGEWATRVGTPTPNLTGAIGDAAYMTGLERNSDVVIMASYAPLFVNVSNWSVPRGTPGASMQWPTDLIGYNALNSYGSPAFYAQVMFNNNRGDVILPVTADNVPTESYRAPPPRGRAGQPATAVAPGPARQLATLYYSATKDTKTGAIYLKVVNTAMTPQAVQINIKGATIAATGEATVLTSANPTDTNSIAEPTKVVPVTTPETGLGSSFTRTFPAFSLTVLKLQGS